MAPTASAMGNSCLVTLSTAEENFEDGIATGGVLHGEPQHRQRQRR